MRWRPFKAYGSGSFVQKPQERFAQRRLARARFPHKAKDFLLREGKAHPVYRVKRAPRAQLKVLGEILNVKKGLSHRWCPAQELGDEGASSGPRVLGWG
jgi:hypothetical protein